MIENKRFNRYETNLEHYYNQQSKDSRDFSGKFSGFIKCKLAHGEGYSIIIPDQLYIEAKSLLWIQPIMFLPNIFFDLGDMKVGNIYIDISMGVTLKVEFNSKGFMRNLSDGSNIFKCNIYGPKDLKQYATGTGIMKDNIPFIKLYHHTSKENLGKILESGYLMGSRWNIQGNKMLENINYIYLTPLDKISKNNDLVEIAMSSNEKIHLMVDDFIQPTIILENWEEQYNDYIATLKVYKENVSGRQHSIAFLVDTSIISTQHILKHSPLGQNSYYEISRPFISRIGVHPGSNLKFKIGKKCNQFCEYEDIVKKNEYVIVGDARYLEGVVAPFDEENTRHILKIERLNSEDNILDFWFNNSNMDHFDSKSVELQKFIDI